MAETWKNTVIRELCDITSSKRIFAADYQSEGVPFYRGREIIEKQKGSLQVSTELFISRSKFDEINAKFGVPQPGDLLLTSVGTLGVPYVVRHGEVFYFKDGNLTWFKDFKNLDSRFLYYWLLSPTGKAELKKCTIGSSQSAFTIVLLKGIEIQLPPFPVQRQIAGILSAYDDLIENNTRRIQILEQMARAIYQEWFVHFRFPGHAQVKLVASPMGKIPQGWEVATLTDVCKSVNDGDWIETKDQGGDEYRLLQISNVGVNEFIETGNFRYITQDTFVRLRCQEVLPDDILISRMPTPIGRAWLVTQMPWRMITAVDVAIVKVAPDRVDPYFLTYQLNSPNQLAACEKNATGTTRPRISKSALCSLPLVIPPMSVQKRYAEIVSVGYAMVTTLRRRCGNLRHTRDLLLPKLISSELDVSKNNFGKGEINYA